MHLEPAMKPGKLIGLDYGTVRTGIALTDELQMIASPLVTVETRKLMEYLDTMLSKENIVGIVLGEAKRLNNTPSEITALQQKFADSLAKKYPLMTIYRVNEMYTSKMASQTLLMAGLKKSDRAKKENLDKVSAAIILQSYLDSRRS